eukprot:CAMPEP_0176374928 /NCGR_PEP_ID=MMETSP0126-20121128/27131_1 /TAXON_ID=141414 ORGANISM="Strombidinopsis acuminatum, Strain SPMC142" /NCGR_SAMPLE_ID=MMETSP0126 /ASSEMBLY_ACC=CAM_ASM_000229 /LENGTH=70 /DNA_ID=CAMNT_0017735761 /DNA_START=1008 /DNA_END=1220 /DNA_ORIENTATION=+
MKLVENGAESAVRFDTKRGVVIGSVDDDLVVLVQLMCQNPSMPEPVLAAQLQMNIEAVLDASFNDFLIDA